MLYPSQRKPVRETPNLALLASSFAPHQEVKINTLTQDYYQIKKDLLRAIAHNEFEVYYQPQVCTKTQTVTSVEALVRWRKPEIGLIFPQDFIPVAEDLGLISQIDELVLNKACHYIKGLQKTGLYLSIAVNLSAETFYQPTLVKTIKSALENSQLEPEYLELELTETMILNNSQQVLKTMKELKLLGIKLSLDDFGTGYSGLLYLQQFPWDTVKIDRYFIHDLSKFAKNRVILNAIISLARNLDLDIVAEGIEEECDLHFLINNNCHRSQGYLFSPPVIADNLIETIHKINYQLASFFHTKVAA